jgi:hypothetical protein
MGKGDGAQDTDLHDISAYLMNTVELIEREPCTEAAALHATATAFSFGQGRPKDGLERRDRRVLRKAFCACTGRLPAHGRATTPEKCNEQRP